MRARARFASRPVDEQVAGTQPQCAFRCGLSAPAPLAHFGTAGARQPGFTPEWTWLRAELGGKYRFAQAVVLLGAPDPGARRTDRAAGAIDPGDVVAAIGLGEEQPGPTRLHAARTVTQADRPRPVLSWASSHGTPRHASASAKAMRALANHVGNISVRNRPLVSREAFRANTNRTTAQKVKQAANI